MIRDVIYNAFILTVHYIFTVLKIYPIVSRNMIACFPSGLITFDI